MQRTGIIAALAVGVLTGCTTMAVHHDFDPDVDFNRYRSFTWMPMPADSGASSASLSGPFVEKRIKKSVIETLVARGFEHDRETPDFLVAYQLHYKRKTNMRVHSYGYGPYPYGHPYAVDANRYKEGTLIIDFVDPITKGLIWRGWAVSDLHVGTSPQDERANIDLAVRKILERYPPY